jgi:hypothetical protein
VRLNKKDQCGCISKVNADQLQKDALQQHDKALPATDECGHQQISNEFPAILKKK